MLHACQFEQQYTITLTIALRKIQFQHTLVSPTPTAKEHEQSRKYDRERNNSTIKSSPINSTQRHHNSNLGLCRDQNILEVKLTTPSISSESFEREVLTPPQLHSTGDQFNSLHDHNHRASAPTTHKILQTFLPSTCRAM